MFIVPFVKETILKNQYKWGKDVDKTYQQCHSDEWTSVQT